MLYYFLTSLAYIIVVRSEEASNVVKTAPTISNSLVNLGKMEISFHFNGKAPELPAKFDHSIPSSSFLFSKTHPATEDRCPCSSLRSIKDSFLTNPSELINKILRSNEHFSFKDPVTSALCCDSHEKIHEETVMFELGPNHEVMKVNPTRNNPIPLPPFIFNSLIPNKSVLPTFKPKAVEILLFPKKKDMASFDFAKMLPRPNKTFNKDSIQKVGDKDMKNVLTFKAVNSSQKSSVKKDLTVESNNKKETEKKDTEVKAKTVGNPNVL